MAQILRELGYLYKRLERRDEAAGVWEDWIGTVSGDDLTPYIELAKHHEWHTLDLAAARLGRLGAAHRRGVAAGDRARRRRWPICVTGWKDWSASWRGSGSTYLLNNPGQLGPVSDRARHGSVRRPATAGKAPEN